MASVADVLVRQLLDCLASEMCIRDSFTTLTISLRPGLGRATVDTWAAGKMPMPVTNVSGVGERAVWQSTLKEINAEKNNLLCDIGVVGPGHGAGATPERLGALCNKIFAAM